MRITLLILLPIFGLVAIGGAIYLLYIMYSLDIPNQAVNWTFKIGFTIFLVGIMVKAIIEGIKPIKKAMNGERYD